MTPQVDGTPMFLCILIIIQMSVCYYLDYTLLYLFNENILFYQAKLSVFLMSNQPIKLLLVKFELYRVRCYCNVKLQTVTQKSVSSPG